MKKLLCALLLTVACSSTQNSAPFGAPPELGLGVRTAHQKAWGISTGVEMSTETKVRFARLWRDPADPDPGFHSCVALTPAQGYVAVLSDTFTTVANTDHVDVSFSAQFTTLSGEVAYEGIIGRATITQDSGAFGQRSQYLPGLGDDFCPFVSRRTEGGYGQQTFAAYHGLVSVEPSTPTTVMLELYSTAGTAYVCFLNLVLRY